MWVCATPATPATQNESECHQVPRLPRRMPRRHARPRRAQASPSAPPSAICPTPATQNDGRCEFVPRLPRRTKVNVTKCHVTREVCVCEVSVRLYYYMWSDSIVCKLVWDYCMCVCVGKYSMWNYYMLKLCVCVIDCIIICEVIVLYVS